MRLRVRHTYDFGSDRERVGPVLASPESWDATRELPGPFGLPEDREEWERQARDPDVVRCAADVAAAADELGARSLCSYGVGTARLELRLALSSPDRPLVCGEVAPGTVARLRALFPEAEVRLHDLRTDPPLPGELHLMHRLDAELDDAAWRSVFRRYPGPILFVPNVLLDARLAVRELGRRILRRGLADAGWFRNEPALRALWRETHEDGRHDVGGRPGFLLTRR